MTATCLVCGASLRGEGKHAHYCSPACRELAHRQRERLDDLERELENTRRRYWEIVAEIAAIAPDGSGSQAITVEGQYVDGLGRVFLHGRLVGTKRHRRHGGRRASEPPR